MQPQTQSFIGAIMLPIRLVTSWLFLSAVHRRFFLAPAKHEFQSEAWLGHKINTFYPHANTGFHESLAYMLRHPEWLNVFTYVFTFSELILGVLLLFGLFSRFTGLLLAGLSVGLMHTAGWLGPTCLDEWQIASLLTTAGLVLAFYGTGRFSADHWLVYRYPSLVNQPWWQWLSYPMLSHQSPLFRRLAISAAVLVTLYVIGMNQVHHGGVWGNLHNYSKKPDIQLSNPELSQSGDFSVTAYRDKGPEAYGTFVIQVQLKNAEGETLHTINREELAAMPKADIRNQFVNKIAPDEHSLQIPLGAKGTLDFSLPGNQDLKPDQAYQVTMTEIGGRTYRSDRVRP